MSSPALELQRVIFGKLKNDSGLAAIVAGRVYDQPPAAPVYPYVTLGEGTVSPERGDLYDGSLTTLAVHGFSRAVGYPEAKRIGAAIRAALHEADQGDIAMADGQRLVELAMTQDRAFRDPDGLTTHVALNFRALTEPV